MPRINSVIWFTNPSLFTEEVVHLPRLVHVDPDQRPCLCESKEAVFFTFFDQGGFVGQIVTRQQSKVTAHLWTRNRNMHLVRLR